MKKRIQTMIILAALLLSTATGCQNRADNLPENSLKDANENYTEVISQDEKIINSVLSSLEKSFNVGDGHTYYNFIDDQVGFFFRVGGDENRIQIFMKTTDGGNEWRFQTVINGPSTHRKEKIICAKMVTESVGLIAGKFYADNENVGNRTYITLDGGMNWYQAAVNRNILCNAEAYDIIYQNDEYILCFREEYLSDDSHEYKYYRCSSKDLKTWTLIEE